MYFNQYISPTSFIFFHPFISSYKIMKNFRTNHTFAMEADAEEDEELGELCAEILENWNSPTYTSHHNPFSLEHHQPLNTTHDVRTAAGKRGSKCLETDISMSKLTHNDRKQNSVLEHKDNRKEPSIIPVLVADTFFDKQLQRYVDGVDIAALTRVQEDNAHENEAESSTVSANNGERMEKLGSGQVSSLFFKPNVPTMNKMPKRSPISGEHRRMQGTSTEAPVNYIRRSFVARYVLPPRKTIFDIDIDEFQEKMWRNPGVNISDFFNYGLDEKQWKNYCNFMQGQTRVRSFRRKEDESTQSLKIAMHNSSYENGIRRQHIKDNGVLTADRGVILRPYLKNTPYMNCRMINGDKISPCPKDSYPDEDGEWKEEQSQQYYDVHFTKLSTERKGDLLISHSEVELTGTDETGKNQSSRTQEDHSLSQRSLKSARFYKGNPTSYHNVNLYLAESSCSPRVESVREKREYYVSHGVQKEYANRTFPTNIHNSGTKMTVEEDTEKLKRRKERFDSSLPILKNVVADTSMEIETTHFKNRV